MLASERDCLKYISGTNVAKLDLELALVEASEWISARVNLNGHVPPSVREATALLASVYVHHPDAIHDPPRMVELMIYPHRPYSSYNQA